MYIYPRLHLNIPVRLVLDGLDADLPKLGGKLKVFSLVGLGIDLYISYDEKNPRCQLSHLAISFGKVSTLDFLPPLSDGGRGTGPRSGLGALFFAHETPFGGGLEGFTEELAICLCGTLLLFSCDGTRVDREGHDGVGRGQRGKVLASEFTDEPDTG